MPEPDGAAAPCIFCEIIAGRAPAYKVYEDDRTIAFLDLFPLTRGHLLVVPKRHAPRLTDLHDGEFGDYLRAVSRVCERINRLSTDYNIGLNQGAKAGQIVFHLHFHVIPRYDEANPFGTKPRQRLVDADAKAVVAALSAS
jgi:histidine triad (HIT) family protein